MKAQKQMAKYDHGGGCPCGLFAECDTDCAHYDEEQQRIKAMSYSRALNKADYLPVASAQPPGLKEIANRVKKLSYRDTNALATLLANNLGLAFPIVAEALLATADEIEGL